MATNQVSLAPPVSNFVTGLPGVPTITQIPQAIDSTLVGQIEALVLQQPPWLKLIVDGVLSAQGQEQPGGQGGPVATAPSAATAPGIRNIVGMGHSLMAGGGSDDLNVRGWGHMLASMLGANFHNYARGGATALKTQQTGADIPGGPGNNGSGGWAWLLGYLSIPIQAVNQAEAGSSTPSPLYPPIHAGGAGQPYMPPPYIPLVFLGNNDLGFYGNTTRALNAFLDAMRTIISRLTAAAVYEENDATVGFNNVFGTTAAQGAWGASLGGGFGVGSGNDIRQIPNSVTAGTAGITINVPQDFQAGDVIALGFAVNPGATGTLQVQVDGSSVGLPNGGVINFANRTAGPPADGTNDQPLGLVYRIPGLSAGNMGAGNSHVITINVTVGCTNAYFDYWQVEPGAEKAAVSCILPSFMHIFQYGIWSPVIIGDADVNQWDNAYRAMIAAEFPNALLVDIKDVVPRTSQHPLWWADQTHLTDAGHALVAQTVYNVVAPKLAAAAPQQVAIQSREVQRDKVAFSNVPQSGGDLNVNWTDFLTSLSNFVVGTPGIVPEVVLPADVGDVIEVGGSLLWDNSGTGLGLADVAIMGGYQGPPQTPTFALAAGGTLAVGTSYWYWLTNTNAHGETVAKGPFGPFIPTAGQQSVVMTTTQGGWKLYRSTGATAPTYPGSGSLFLASGSGNYTDNGGTALTAGFPPSRNSAWGGPVRYLAGSGLNSTSAGIAGWVANATSWEPVTPCSHHFTAIPADIVPGTGAITLRLVVRLNAAGSRFLKASYGGQFWAKNHGRQSTQYIGAS